MYFLPHCLPNDIYLYLWQNKEKPCEMTTLWNKKRKSKRYIRSLYVSIMSWTRKELKKNTCIGNVYLCLSQMYSMSLLTWGVCQSKKKPKKTKKIFTVKQRWSDKKLHRRDSGRYSDILMYPKAKYQHCVWFFFKASLSCKLSFLFLRLGLILLFKCVSGYIQCVAKRRNSPPNFSAPKQVFLAFSEVVWCV